MRLRSVVLDVWRCGAGICLGHISLILFMVTTIVLGNVCGRAETAHNAHAKIRRSPAARSSSLSLTELANLYNSDKGTRYKCSHGYTRIYEKIFRKLKVGSLLEIGLNRDGTTDIPSLKMWRDYFPAHVKIYGLDIEPAFLQCSDPSKSIEIIIGDQSVAKDLLPLTKRKYDIIIDDGLHASKHQQVSLDILWNSLNSGGVYIIEDLHVRVDKESGVRTRELLAGWKRGVFNGSAYIDRQRAQAIGRQIDKIEMYDSASPIWSLQDRQGALAVIFKK